MALAAFLFAMIGFSLLYARDAHRERRRRLALFDAALGLFDSYRVTHAGTRYPVLEGCYRGLAVRLEPVLDDMAWRKLPSLWLKATLLTPHRSRGTLDFLVRPQGTEFYSAQGDLPEHVAVPSSWPQHAVLATDNAATMPSLAVLTPHIADLFSDPKMKELVITPRGLRLVYQAAQARRAEYLVLRQARFATDQLDPALVVRLFNRLAMVANDLDGHPPVQTAA